MSLNGLTARFNNSMTEFELSHKDLSITITQKGDNRIQIVIEAPIEVIVKKVIEKEG